MGFPWLRAWSWCLIGKLWTGIGVQWWHPWWNFSIWLVSAFIGLLSLLSWSTRGRSGFCLLGLSFGFFMPLGCDIGLFLVSQFRKFWFVFLGVCLCGLGIGFGPYFMGEHWPVSAGLDMPLCYIDPLPCVDCCHDIYFAIYNFVNDSQTNKQTILNVQNWQTFNVLQTQQCHGLMLPNNGTLKMYPYHFWR